MKESFLDPYNIGLFVYKIRGHKDKRMIIDAVHSIELKHHRDGLYFALQCTNFHCADATNNCKCGPIRCWNFEEVPSRRQPHCIKFFGIDVSEEYRDDNIVFLLSDLRNKSKYLKEHRRLSV